MITASDYVELSNCYLRARRSVDVFRAVEELARSRIGFRLMTMLHLSPDGEEVRRLHTTDPVNYPVSGTEKLGQTEWGRQVLREQRPYLGVDADAVRWAFPGDFDLIASLGLGATINVPIVALDRTLGSLNLLDAANAYDTRHLAAAVSLGPYLSTAFMEAVASG